MFTGMIEMTGRLHRVRQHGQGASLEIEATAAMVSEMALGESVAVDGACLTVTAMAGARFEADASAETLARTTLGARRSGDGLHLERALRLGDRFGGHLVAGHVDGTGTVRSIAPLGSALCLWVNAPSGVARYLVEKGSIAIDGVSLTVNEVDARGFSVALIPHTQGVVRLHEKRAGQRVNLEADLIGKYIERLLAFRAGEAERPTGGVDLALLARSGFLR